MSDQFKGHQPSTSSFGTMGAVIVPDNDADLTEFAKAIVVTDVTAGANLQILPVGNADGAWIDLVGVPVGYSPPWRIRRVGTGTDCTVASVLG